MTTRKYLSTSQETTLTSAMNSSQTTMVVNSASGLLGSITPAAGETFTVVIDPDTSLEEIVDVVAPSNPGSNTLTIVRPIDGTAAIAHSAGAKVRHMATGRDFREANTHQESNLTAHAATTSAQLASVISDETGTGSLVFNTNPTIVTPTIASFTNANHNHTNSAGGGTLTSAAVSDFTEAAQDAVGAMFSGNTESGISVTYDDATNKVNFDVNDPVITLSGDVTGSATMTDLGNTTITTAISAGSIVAADIADGTITSSKIADGTIVNADISAAAGITLGKLATDPLARANHTGTQTASTISDFDTQVRTSRLNQMTSPNAAVSMNSQKLSDLATPTAGTDAANKSYVDTQVSNLVASAPGALDTLNELASALGNDANFSTTVTNSIATKVSKSGDTMTGNLTMSGGSKVTGIPTPTVSSDAVPLDYVTTLYGSTSSAATSAAAASTSAANAATSATASSNSATSAAASATAANASAVAAAASAASVDATATTATELRQYAAEDSILPNLPARVPVAEGLLRQAAYWVDATNNAYIPTTASGYMYLPGVSGNYASAPDSNALDITGDIDVRLRLGLDSWRPTAEQTVIGKWTEPTNQRSWALNIQASGIPRVFTTSGGTAGTQRTHTADAAIPFIDGQIGWIRFTIDVDNGAGGSTTTFFTSTDGTTWTQLGSAIVISGTISIFAGTAPLEVGSIGTGTINPTRGKFYRAQVLNGIGGTVAFDANFETAMTSQTVASFTESSTNSATVTINRNTYNFQLDTLNNLGWAGDLLPTTLGSSTAADSNDPKFLDWTGTNYVYLPGVASNYISVPDSAALRITGDIDLRAYVAPDTWTPAAAMAVVSKWNSSTGLRSYTLQISTTGALTLNTSADGTTGLLRTSTVNTGFSAGQAKWIRATLDVDNGASGNTATFFTSDDGSNWTQLGATVVNAGTTSIVSNATNVEVGSISIGSGSLFAGKIYRAQIFDGIDGTKVLDVDTSVITTGSATSFYALSGQTVTINRSTSGRKTVAVVHPCWLFGTDDYMEVNNRYMSSGTYLYLPGVASNYASTPDAAALDITSDLDLRVKVAMDDWTPANASVLLAKRTSSTTQVSYSLFLNTTGTLVFLWSTDGTTPITRTSTVATGIADGATKWVRVTLDVDNGASGHDVVFYTSDDGITWTQLGTTITTAGTTSVYSGTAILEIGSTSGGSSSTSRGKFFRAQVRNGIDGTIAFDANFETSITSLLQTSFTESSANAATVTINRSGSAYRSAGITQAGYLYPGATNTFRANSVDYLNFGASDSFTILAVTRQWSSSIATNGLVSKGSTSATPPGYTLYKYAGGPSAYFQVADGTVNPTAQTVAQTAGAILLSAGVRDISSDNLIAYAGSTAGTAVTDTTTASLANFTQFFIGRTSTGGYLDGELVAAAVFRRALTAGEIATISTYYAGRVGA